MWVMEVRKGSGPWDGPARAASGGQEAGAVLGRAGSGIKQTLDETLDPALGVGPYANCFSSLSLSHL